MTRTLTALATAATLALSGAAYAQTMGEGYDMLTSALMGDFERLGLPTDIMDNLTLGQLAAIKAVLESEDNDGQTRGQIEAIIANN